MNHDDMRHHDSAIRNVFSMMTCIVMIAVNWLREHLAFVCPSGSVLLPANIYIYTILMQLYILCHVECNRRE